LRDWHRPLDLLPGGIETSIDADSTLTDTVDRIMLATGLACLPRAQALRAMPVDSPVALGQCERSAVWDGSAGAVGSCLTKLGGANVLDFSRAAVDGSRSRAARSDIRRWIDLGQGAEPRPFRRSGGGSRYAYQRGAP